MKSLAESLTDIGMCHKITVIYEYISGYATNAIAFTTNSIARMHTDAVVIGYSIRFSRSTLALAEV